MTRLLERGLESLRNNGDVIYIHNLQRPMRERVKAREVVGPYMWKPAKPGMGRGFYQASDGLRCDPNGSTFDLRLESANDHLSGRLSHTDGYYCDSFQGDTLQPIIARLPHGRGFLAGWTMGRGMCASIDADIYRDAESAAFAAHSKADSDAERSRDEEESEPDDESESDESVSE